MPAYKYPTFAGSIAALLSTDARKNVHLQVQKPQSSQAPKPKPKPKPLTTKPALQFMLVGKSPGVVTHGAGDTYFKCRIADSTGEMGAIFYDNIGLTMKVGDVFQLKEGALLLLLLLPPLLLLLLLLPLSSHRHLSGYTMVYTHMGNPALFLYKGREGFLEKIDEINMEVRSWGWDFTIESQLTRTRSCTAAAS